MPTTDVEAQSKTVAIRAALNVRFEQLLGRTVRKAAAFIFDFDHHASGAYERAKGDVSLIGNDAKLHILVERPIETHRISAL